MFTLSITLGNDAMQTPVDVAIALAAVIEKLNRGSVTGTVRDTNGNNVGAWEFKPEADTETE